MLKIKHFLQVIQNIENYALLPNNTNVAIHALLRKYILSKKAAAQKSIDFWDSENDIYGKFHSGREITPSEFVCFLVL